MRVQGAPGDSNSHVENRIGEPAANPYLYMAANIAAGLDGIRRKLEPPAPVEADPYAAEAIMLPTSLREAVGALVEDSFYRKAFGDPVVDYLIQMKRAELARHQSAIAENPPPDGQDVSDWEMREYFEFYWDEKMTLQHIVLFSFPTALSASDEDRLRAMVASWPREIGLITSAGWAPTSPGPAPAGTRTSSTPNSPISSR